VSSRLSASRACQAAFIAWCLGLLPIPLLSVACVAAPPHQVWGISPALGPKPTSYQQCVNPFGPSNPACVAPVASSTGEILAPAATRAGQALGTAVRAAQAIQGFITLARLLTEAEKKQVEDILVECAKHAEAKVNESYQRREGSFADGLSPNKAECDRVLRVEKGEKITLARELGILKHDAAFQCVEDRLSDKFPGNFSIEPRYRPDPESGATGYILTDTWAGSLKPDFVLHFTRNATRLQCVYDFKFPCPDTSWRNPLNASVRQQLQDYGQLTPGCAPAVITPRRLVRLE